MGRLSLASFKVVFGVSIAEQVLAKLEFAFLAFATFLQALDTWGKITEMKSHMGGSYFVV